MSSLLILALHFVERHMWQLGDFDVSVHQKGLLLPTQDIVGGLA